jgi:hypothetical protein
MWSMDIDPIDASAFDQGMEVDSISTAFSVNINEQDRWKIQWQIDKQNFEFFTKFKTDDTSQDPLSKTMLAFQWSRSEVYWGNAHPQFAQGLIWSSPYGRMRSTTSASQLIKNKLKLKRNGSSTDKLKKNAFTWTTEWWRCKSAFSYWQNGFTIINGFGPVSILYNNYNERHWFSMGWDVQLNNINLSGEWANNDSRFASIINFYVKSERSKTLVRISNFDTEWTSINGKIGFGKSENVHSIFLQHQQKVFNSLFSCWYYFEDEKENKGSVIFSQKDDISLFFHIPNLYSLQFNYREVKSPITNYSLNEYGLEVAEHENQINQWVKFKWGKNIKISSQFHFGNGEYKGALGSVLFIYSFEKYELKFGAFTSINDGTFYKFQQGLTSEFLIDKINGEQNQIFTVGKFNYNERLQLSYRIEYEFEDKKFQGAAQLDIVF